MQSDFTQGQQRYWPGVEGDYTYFEPLTAEEYASQRAWSSAWRNYGNNLAEGAGQAAAAYPLFGEAAYDTYKVVSDLAGDFSYRQHRASERDYVQVRPRHHQSMSGPGGYLFTGRQRSTGYLPSGSIATGIEPRKRVRREFAGEPRNLNPEFDQAMSGQVIAGGMLSLPRIKRTRGRKVPEGRRLRKIMRAELGALIYRWQGVRPYSLNSYGMFAMNNYVNTATASGFDQAHWLPWHVFDLTTCSNRIDGNSTLRTFTPFGYQIALTYGNTGNPSNAGIAWRPILGSRQDGTDYGTQVIGPETNIQRNDSDLPMVPGNRSVLDWVDIRTILYGNATTQSMFEIALIQFVEDDFQPGFQDGSVQRPETFTDSTNTTLLPQYNNDTNVRRRVAEWMRKWISSPIIPPSGGVRDKPFVKYLFRRNFVITAKPTYNPDTQSPSMLQFEQFFNMNRLCKWDWNFQDTGLAATAAQNLRLQDDGYRTIDTNVSNQPYLDPKARVYLSIRSNPLQYTNATAGNLGTFNNFNSNSTSYDLMVRMKHTLLVN